MTRCPDRTHMKEDTGTRTTPYRHQTPMHKTRAFAHATLMGGRRIHIAKLRTLSATASSSPTASGRGEAAGLASMFPMTSQVIFPGRRSPQSLGEPGLPGLMAGCPSLKLPRRPAQQIFFRSIFLILKKQLSTSKFAAFVQYLPHNSIALISSAAAPGDHKPSPDRQLPPRTALKSWATLVFGQLHGQQCAVEFGRELAELAEKDAAELRQLTAALVYELRS